jgi:hypothetical protein
LSVGTTSAWNVEVHQVVPDSIVIPECFCRPARRSGGESRN